MQHEVKIGIEVQHDALSDASRGLDAPAVDFAQRRIERANEKGARHAHLRELAADDATAQVEQVHFDVGQLGHGGYRV